MSLKDVSEQISKFLSSDEPGVMAIKGEWGVGKTFSWQKFLLEAKSKGGIKLERYSYVSLFGINSLDAFKYAIFENTVKRDIIGSEATVETLKSNTNSLIERFGRHSIKLFKGAPIIKSFSPALEAISFLSLNSCLICIDDLERRGGQLEVKDILGLLSLLKEQRKCKIVLLLNDDEEGLEDYDKYREKVIDIELKFAPSALECAKIAYSNQTPNYSKLRELTASLEIRNIRVLKKIERLIKLSEPLTKKFEKELKDSVMHSLVLYTWSYFSSMSNEDIPTLDFISEKGYLHLRSNEGENSEKHKKWQTTLSAYGHIQTDELDLILVEAVKSGYFNEAKFYEKAELKNQEIIASKSEKSFSKAWRLYHDSFLDNADEVIQSLYESFKKNCKFITPINLDGTVSLLRELGEEEKASEIIDIYIRNRKDDVELFNTNGDTALGRLNDEEIQKKFKETYSQLVVKETPKEVLSRISGQQGWNDSDELILANTTVEEYYTLFKSEVGSHLASYVTRCLKFGQYANANDQQKEISKKATEALQRIASESKINQRRVSKFGVEVA
ncbi:hypothetical protein [Alteromonas mediterranea]|uniref:hypothetical protein n=1 Tax=Alteromonas mediterranea TaxID=314275 RepID=UPI0012FA8C46|nr:hypothetical protein [Alteromonas mediterranea]QGX61452.1 hypothetical protein FJN15_06705 [Alteromonas mediterranea]